MCPVGKAPPGGGEREENVVRALIFLPFLRKLHEIGLFKGVSLREEAHYPIELEGLHVPFVASYHYRGSHRFFCFQRFTLAVGATREEEERKWVLCVREVYGSSVWGAIRHFNGNHADVLAFEVVKDVFVHEAIILLAEKRFDIDLSKGFDAFVHTFKRGKRCMCVFRPDGDDVPNACCVCGSDS